MVSNEFGTYLKKLRNATGLTLEQLGEEVGVSKGYLSHIENGTRPTPSLELLKKLAIPLGVKVSDLLFEAGYISEAETEIFQMVKKIIDDTKKGGWEEDRSIWEGIVDISFKVPSYEKTTLPDGKKVRAVISHEELTRRFFDIDYLLKHREEAYYNGHKLTDHDKQRILILLEQLFPQYAPKQDNT